MGNIRRGGIERLRRALLGWYDVHRRDLPWRGNSNPYHIWLSEIMLQQTRVAAVLEHYRIFFERFPTVAALAAASQEKVLAAWSGLGYYRRARALHRAAREITTAGGEGFPKTPTGLRRLSGIGRYTSAAIASIAFGVAVAAVDGNVKRVLSRLFARSGGRELTPVGAPGQASQKVGHEAPSKTQASAVALNGLGDPWVLADILLHRSRPGDWNQAMMELGATLCLPRRPLCSTCPLKQWCEWHPGEGNSKQRVATTAPPRRKRMTSYGLALRNGSAYLVRRPLEAAIMAGMWELPELAPSRSPAPGRKSAFKLRHAITTTDYEVTVVTLSHNSPGLEGGRWVSRKRISELPLTGLARKILRRAGVI